MKNKKIPKKGFEAWFYKNFPGTISSKKAFLVLIIVLMFSSSFVLLAKADVIPTQEDESEQFAKMIINTKLK